MTRRRKTKTKKPISNFRRGVNFEHRVRKHYKEKEGFPYAERSYGSLGPADVWCYKPIIVTKEMIGQILTKLLLVQCKTNRYYFNQQQKQNLLNLSVVTGGEPILVYRNKKRGPLMFETVV